MNILLISDDPNRESFRQILRLKGDIEDITRKQVDLITFSPDGVFLNKKLTGKKLDVNVIFTTLENILKTKSYRICIISLELKYLKQLFPDERNILDLINKTSPNATVFIFGANSILKPIRKEKGKQVFLYARHGVAKITRELKSQIITYIKSLSKLK